MQQNAKLAAAIRAILLTEAAKTAADLGDDCFVRIIEEGNSATIEIISATATSRGMLEILGKIQISAAEFLDDGGAADGAWIVRHSKANKCWGPMLYDLAIEYATKRANGLASDRFGVSADARKIWHYYYTHRKSDVKSHQLDNPENHLTPERIDNCFQVSAGQTNHDDHWVNSPLSKRYTKKPTTLNALRAAGKLQHLRTRAAS